MAFPRIPPVLAAVLVCLGAGAAAQTPPVKPTQPPPVQPTEPQRQALRVFLDCRTRCDFDFLRTEITFINYVRDRKDAELHVLVTSQRTGGGGTEYTLKFIGLERFAGQDDSLLYVSGPTDTDDEQRRGFAQIFALGLMRYVARTPLAQEIQITQRRRADRQPAPAAATPADDPWNFWIFRASTSGSFFAEERTERRSVRGSFSANRTTDEWRISLSASGDYNESHYDLDEEGIYVNVSRDLDLRGLAVKSLGDHWAAAARVAGGSSTFVNLDRAVGLFAGIEYNVFPYAESTRREFTFQYTIGPDWVHYDEETVFNKIEETVYSHKLLVELSLRQPWGTSFVNGELSQYLHDLSKNSIEVGGRLEMRLFRGFTFNVDGNVSRIRDQIYLPKGEATPEEVLLLRRQLATDYRYRFGFGVSYTFGSIYNNVVNPRFGGR